MNVRDVEDALFRFDGHFLELSEQVLAESPTARLHLLRAGAGRIFGIAIDPLAEVAKARELPCEPVDDSLAAALGIFLVEGPHRAAELFVEHSKAFPDDLFGAYFRFSSLVVSGVLGNRERAVALVEFDAGRLGGDWRFDAMLAMVREEARRYDEAREIAERTLAEQPDCAPAAHVITHVNYETGEHAAGIAWLDDWRRERTFLFYGTHFPWHNALHALALGDIDGALARFHGEIGSAAVIDAGSLLWRCRLANAQVQEEGIAAAVGAAAVLEALPLPFAAFNGCLALAAAGDASTLASLAERAEADARPAFADLIAPIARGLLAMVDGRPDDTVAFLGPVLRDLPRLGGSDAQREGVEDTLLRAFIAAGRADEAEPLLRARLERRPHALDCQLLMLACTGR
jgi:hypothetical protein